MNINVQASEIKYPATVVFHLTRDTRTGQQRVSATSERGTTKPENRRYGDIKQISLLKDVDMAIISVKTILSDQELLRELNRLTERWEVRKEAVKA